MAIITLFAGNIWWVKARKPIGERSTRVLTIWFGSGSRGRSC
jgi:hypothetical protein